MPINPNIALGVRPIEQPNMLGQMAQVMAMRQAQQEYEGSAGVNDLARRGERDPYAYIQYGKPGQAAAASITKIQKEKFESDEKRNVILGGLAGPVMENPTPQTFNFALDRAVNYGIMTPTQKQEVLAQYGGNPESIKSYAAQIFKGSITAQAQQANATSIANNQRTVGATIHGQDLTNARALEGTWSSFNVGNRVLEKNSRTGEVREVQDPYNDKGFTINVGPITPLPETPANGGAAPAKTNMLPSTVGVTPSVTTDVNGLRNPPAITTTAPVLKTRPPVTNPLMIQEKPVWNEKAGVFMYPPSEDNPKGKVVEVPALQEAVQKRTANATLKVAGYDPKTKTDEISNLIKQSTSGLGENWANKIWSAISGTGSKGAEAIAQLETRANEMTLALAPNGSLGAGFSNEDRDFMLGKLGDVANPNKPMNVRLAAWEDVMERTARNAGVPYTKQSLGSSSAKSSPKVIQFGELPK